MEAAVFDWRDESAQAFLRHSALAVSLGTSSHFRLTPALEDVVGVAGPAAGMVPAPAALASPGSLQNQEAKRNEMM